MRELLTLTWVVVASAAIAYGFAGHDAQAGRRFRELPAAVVQTDTDRQRNARWHTFGAWLRFAVCGLVAAIAGLVLDARYAVFGLAWLLSGLIVSLGFDLLFNAKAGLPLDYLGTTARVDVWVNLAGAGDWAKLSDGAFWSALELGGVLLAVGFWVWLI